jgi:hypothetical protein
MGQSTDAIFGYGICFDAEESFDYDIAERVEKELEEFGVGYCSHCSGDYPMGYLYITSTINKAYRGSPETIDVIECARRQEDFQAQWDKDLFKAWGVVRAAFRDMDEAQAEEDDCGDEVEDPDFGSNTDPRWFICSDWN